MSEHSGHKLVFNTDPGPIILFKDWKLETSAGVAATCILIAIWALLYEGVKFFRNTLFEERSGKALKPRNSPFYWQHLLQTVLHLLQLLGGYVLMLVAMTMNVWLFLSILAGLGIGYFIYGWAKIQLTSPTNRQRNDLPGRHSRKSKMAGMMVAGEGKTPNHYELEPLQENHYIKPLARPLENGVMVMNVTSI